MNIAFVLVRPEYPGNIGSAARAMKTMGFADLRLVAPVADPQATEAIQMAHSSQEILADARRFDTVADAVADTDLAIGTTVRPRFPRLPIHPADKLPGLLADKGPTVSTAAIVFGPERTGLTVDDLAPCDMLSAVPMAVRQPPLNLAQAVMIYAYVLSPLVAAPPIEPPAKPDPAGRLASLRQKVDSLMIAAGMEPQVSARRRILEGLARMTYADLGLVHHLCDELGKHLAGPAGPGA